MILTDIKLKIILSLGLMLVVIICSVLFKDDPKEQYKIDKCRWSRSMKMKSNSGVIKQKYLDRAEHFYPTLMIDQGEKGASFKVEFQNEKSGFYEYVTVGDTVQKNLIHC